MSYIPGQILVHPFHGPAEVVDITTRHVGGGTIDYLDLLPRTRSVLISVPIANIALVGLRPVINTSEADALLDVLRAESLPRERSWSRRIKDYQLRLQSGTLESRAVVYREICRNAGPNPSGAAEKALLRNTRDLLVAELALSYGIASEEAVTRIEMAALGNTSAVTATAS